MIRVKMEDKIKLRGLEDRYSGHVSPLQNELMSAVTVAWRCLEFSFFILSFSSLSFGWICIQYLWAKFQCEGGNIQTFLPYNHGNQERTVLTVEETADCNPNYTKSRISSSLKLYEV